jgi:hypothetical protein
MQLHKKARSPEQALGGCLWQDLGLWAVGEAGERHVVVNAHHKPVQHVLQGGPGQISSESFGFWRSSHWRNSKDIEREPWLLYVVPCRQGASRCLASLGHMHVQTGMPGES